MIRQDSITQAYAMAEKYAQRGVRIAPRPGTPLAEAVLASIGYDAANDETIDHLSLAISKFTRTQDLDNPTPHAVVMDQIVQLLSRSVTSHIKYARSVVKPLVVEYGESVEHALEAYEPSLPSSQFNIISYEMPALISDVSFMMPLERHRGNMPVQPSKVGVLAPATGDQILEMMLTGDPTVDEDIKAWYTTQEPSFFEGLWAGFFSDQQNDVKVLDYDDILPMNVFEKAYSGLSLYLLSNKLYNEPPEGTPLTLADWNERLSEIRNYGAALFTQALIRYEKMLRTNLMVLAVNSSRKYCLVNGVVYNQWLKEGGKPEILFGMITANQVHYTTSAVTQNAEEFLRSWANFVSIYKSREINERFDVFKSILTSQFAALMNHLTDEEKEFIEIASDYNGEVTKRFKKELESVRLSDMETIYDTALRLVCRARFYYTDAEKILSNINEAIKLNPNLQVREAALIATIEYICDYIGEQFTKTL